MSTVRAMQVVLVASAVIACGGSERAEPAAMRLQADGPPARLHRFERYRARSPSERWLNAVALAPDGRSGWAVGESGEMLRLQAGEWTRDPDPRTDARLYALALEPGGEAGWAVGADGQVMRLEAGAWHRDDAASEITSRRLYALALADDGRLGWAAGEAGVVLRLESGRWSQDIEASALVPSTLYSLALDAHGRSGWAVGDDGALLGLKNGRWTRDTPALDWPSSRLCSVAVSADGSVAWIVGADGVVLHFVDDRWARDRDASGLASFILSAVTIDASGSEGWAVGEKGVVLRLEDRVWARDNTATTSNAWFSAVAWHSDDRGGWLAGQGGELVRLSSTAHAPRLIALDGAQLEDLRGPFELSCPSGFSCRLGLAHSDTYTRLPVRPLAGGDALTSIDGTVRFRLDAAQLVPDGTPAQLSVRMVPWNRAYARRASYRSEEFRVGGPPAWHATVFGIAGVMAINLALVLLGGFSALTRRLLLHKAGAQAVGLVVGKYLVVDVALHFVQWIRLAWFRDYRRALRRAEPLERWTGARYAPPNLTVVDPRVHAQTADAEESTAHLCVLEALLRAPKGVVWLVQGRSGLGKTALLENWTRALVRSGQTPLLIRLGTDLAPADEAAQLMSSYGDLPVDAQAATDLLNAGGFVILLDGLNEDRHESETRSFVRALVRRNTVIASSQQPPRWPTDLPVQEIRLEPFGERQLLRFMAKRWVDALRLRTVWYEEACLPQIAILLGEYIARHGDLPNMRLDLFEDVRQQVDMAATAHGLPNQVVHLESLAWELFRLNKVDFTPSGAVSAALCEEAKRAGLLTNVAEQFRFRHERIHRFMVACDRVRRVRPADVSQQQLAAWDAEIEDELGDSYWVDVCDFMAEHCARQSPAAYPRLVLELGNFAPVAFSERLYDQARRLNAANIIYLEASFYEAAAGLLCGKPEPRGLRWSSRVPRAGAVLNDDSAAALVRTSL